MFVVKPAVSLEAGASVFDALDDRAESPATFGSHATDLMVAFAAGAQRALDADDICITWHRPDGEALVLIGDGSARYAPFDAVSAGVHWVTARSLMESGDGLRCTGDVVGAERLADTWRLQEVMMMSWKEARTILPRPRPSWR